MTWPSTWDHNNRWDQANLYIEIGEPRRAMEHLDVLRRKMPDNAEVAVELARVQHSLGGIVWTLNPKPSTLNPIP